MVYNIKKVPYDIDFLGDFHSEMMKSIKTLKENYYGASDEDKYMAFCHIYDIKIDVRDYLELLSNIKKTDYSNIGSIETFYEYMDKHGLVHRERYDCAVKEDFKVIDKRYTKKEIKLLIDKNIIVPLLAVDVIFHDYSIDRKRKSYALECFDDHINYTKYGSCRLNATEDCYKYVVRFLEERIGRRKALEDLKVLLFDYYCVLQNLKTQYAKNTDEYSMFNKSVVEDFARVALAQVKLK